MVLVTSSIAWALLAYQNANPPRMATILGERGFFISAVPLIPVWFLFGDLRPVPSDDGYVPLFFIFFVHGGVQPKRVGLRWRLTGLEPSVPAALRLPGHPCTSASRLGGECRCETPPCRSTSTRRQR